MKKTLKITSIVIVSLLALLILIPFAFRGKIDQIVKKQASAMLNANLSFDKLGISLLRYFPNASVDLKNIAITGIDKFEGDTLVSAERISVVVNVMSLFDDSFEVSKLILDSPAIYATQLKTGEVNWDIMKPSDKPEVAMDTTTTENSDFKLSIKDLRINKGQVTYINQQSDMSFYTDNLNIRMKGDLAADLSDVKLKGESTNIYFVSGTMAMLNKADMALDITIEADLENSKFTFKDNYLRLNAIELSLDGYATMKDDDAIEMDIKLVTPKLQFKELLSMIPAFYTKDFKDLKASGELSLEAWAKGRYKGEMLPAFEATLNVANGSFKYAELPKSVDKIDIKASATSVGGSADNTKLNVEKLSMEIAGNTLDATLSATTPLSDLNFSATAKGVVNLAMIKEVYPLGDSINLNGVIKADIDVAGKMSDITNKRYESITANGTFSVSDMVAQLTGLPTVEVSEASASISPQALTLSSLNTKIGNSDLSATGSLTNYLAYVLRNDKLTGKLNIKSKLIDLNELLGEDKTNDVATENKTEDTTSLSVFVVPENLDIAMSASIDKIKFQKMTLDNFSGLVTVANGTVKMDKLVMTAMGGRVGAGGLYSTTESITNPTLVLGLDIANCSFERTFAELDMIKKLVPLFEKTGGTYSMKFDMVTKLNSEMSPELMTMSAKGVLTTGDVNIQNIKAFDALAIALNDKRLKSIQAKNVKISFTVENGLIRTAPFDIKLGDVNLNLSGTTGLDQSINYAIKATLPKSMGGLISHVNATIGGTFADPKVSLGLKEAVNDAIKNTVNKEIEKLTGGKSVEQALSDQTDKLKTEANEKLREQAQIAGDKLIATARTEGDKLVSKAKNPIAKALAQKSAEAMVKQAEVQARKMVEAIK